MIKTLRLRNLIAYGQITGAALDSLLEDRSYLGALYELRNDARWVSDVAQSPVAIEVLGTSEKAIRVLEGYSAIIAAMSKSQTVASFIAESPSILSTLFASPTNRATMGASTLAMVTIVSSPVAMQWVAANTSIATPIFSSNEAMNAMVTSNEIITTAISSTDMLAAIFDSAVARLAIWGSAMALNALSANNDAKAWLRTKKSAYFNAVGTSGQSVAGRSLLIGYYTNLASISVTMTGLAGGSGIGSFNPPAPHPTAFAYCDIKAFKDMRASTTSSYAVYVHYVLID